MQRNNKLMATGLLILGLSAAGAVMASPATENTRYLSLGAASQDSETGYRVGFERRSQDSGFGFHFDAMSRSLSTSSDYARQHLGVSWGGRQVGGPLLSSGHWTPVEVGWRRDWFFIDEANRSNEQEDGVYVATQLEDWPTDRLGYRVRGQYADVDGSAGLDVRLQGLVKLSEKWTAQASYETASSGRIEEDIIDAGVQMTW